MQSAHEIDPGRISCPVFVTRFQHTLTTNFGGPSRTQQTTGLAFRGPSCGPKSVLGRSDTFWSGILPWAGICSKWLPEQSKYQKTVLCKMPKKTQRRFLGLKIFVDISNFYSILFLIHFHSNFFPLVSHQHSGRLLIGQPKLVPWGDIIWVH